MPDQRFITSGSLLQAPGVGDFNPRDLLTFGTYMPGKGTVGLLNDKILTPYEGDFATKYNGQIVRDLDIEGQLKVRHDYCRFTNVRANGLTYTNQPYYVCVDCTQARAAGSLTEFYDCAFSVPSNDVLYPAVIQGQQMKLVRCTASGAVDGIKPQIKDVYILGCRVFGLTWHASDPAQTGGLPWDPVTNPAGGTHNDGIQIGGGDNINVIGTLIEIDNALAATHMTSCILVKPDAALISNLAIQDSWLISKNADGTGTGLNMVWSGSAGNGPYSGTCVVNGLKFSPLDTFAGGYAGMIDHLVGANLDDLSNNTYVDTGLPARVAVWSS